MNEYKQLHPIYVGERGWSLSKHPGNHGKFSIEGLTNNEFRIINEWVNLQKEYIQKLSLDTKAAILLCQTYPRAYDEDLNTLSLLSEKDEKLRELIELVPSSEVILRYKYLVQNAILNAPLLPIDVIVYAKLYTKMGIKVNTKAEFPSFIHAYITELKNNNIDLLLIKLKIGSRCLYMDAGFGNGNEILLPIGTELYVESINNNKILTYPILKSTKYDKLDEKYIITDDVIFYENAKKESLEETSIDISAIGKITHIIDYPLYKQIEYCSSSTYDSYVLVPTAHGIAASGTLFICSEDKKILLFQRSFLGDFGGTWASVGGAIGENRVPIYKTQFIFRTYIIDIPLSIKRLWNAKNLPRINYEHLTYHWFDINEILPQLDDFGNFDDYIESKRVTNFLRTYTSQIPLASTSLDIRKKILHYGKFAIYVKNPYTHLYELIIPGMSYALWKLKSYLKSLC